MRLHFHDDRQRGTAYGRSASGFTILETLFVVALIGIISVIAVPMAGNAIANFKITGDVRSVSNGVSLAKMRAASDFSRVRLYVDLSSRTHKLQVWSKASPTCCWVTESGLTYLSSSTSLSYGIVSTPPPNTQGTIGQALACTNDAGANIANTACIMFNSRGVPIDNTFAPYSDDALYVTDGTAVYGVTVAATGMIRTWRTQPTATPTWVLQ